TQESLYKHEVSPLVDAFVEGFNATLFAYGQTGSGKTFTMGTSVPDISSPAKRIGMIPRAIHQIFNMIQSLRDKDQQSPLDSPTSSYTVKVSFLELHNEEWVDLLKEPSLAHASRISIREDKEGRISIHGATNVVVASPEAALALLAKGSKIRSTAATGMNETSSRSHAIFSLTLITTQVTNQQQQWSRSLQKQAGTGNTTIGLTISSKFHFVDLAGSERLKRTQNTGDRKAEGISINQGLLVLGRVINCLTDSKNTCADAVVPYRDSKLTRFLQDSLGGNSKTVMLACVSALETDLPETINTLRYASRARGIQ
ncbi:kinesin motor domain-containing protein, partial [Obelidium mucronatum]